MVHPVFTVICWAVRMLQSVLLHAQAAASRAGCLSSASLMTVNHDGLLGESIAATSGTCPESQSSASSAPILDC